MTDKERLINDLIYLRLQLDNLIDTTITEDVFRNRYNKDKLKESLLYRIEDILLHQELNTRKGDCD